MFSIVVIGPARGLLRGDWLLRTRGETPANPMRASCYRRSAAMKFLTNTTRRDRRTVKAASFGRANVASGVVGGQGRATQISQRIVADRNLQPEICHFWLFKTVLMLGFDFDLAATEDRWRRAGTDKSDRYNEDRQTVLIIMESFIVTLWSTHG